MFKRFLVAYYLSNVNIFQNQISLISHLFLCVTNKKVIFNTEYLRVEFCWGHILFYYCFYFCHKVQLAQDNILKDITLLRIYTERIVSIFKIVVIWMSKKRFFSNNISHNNCFTQFGIISSILRIVYHQIEECEGSASKKSLSRSTRLMFHCTDVCIWRIFKSVICVWGKVMHILKHILPF